MVNKKATTRRKDYNSGWLHGDKLPNPRNIQTVTEEIEKGECYTV